MSSGQERRVLRDLLAGGAGQIAAATTGFAIVPMLTWLLNGEQLGAWSLIASVAVMIGLANIGLEMAVQRAVVKQDDALSRRSLGFSLLAVAVIGPLLALFLVTTQLDFQGLDPDLLREARIATGITLLAGFIAATNLPYQAFVYARGGYNAIAAARAAANLCQLVCYLGFLIKPALWVPATALLIANAVEFSVSLRAARRLDPLVPLRPLLPPSRKEAWQTIRDGLAQVSINFSVVTADRVDLFVLTWATALRFMENGMSESDANKAVLVPVGQFYIAATIVTKAFTLAKQANTVLIRRLGDPKERRSALWIGTAVFSTVIVAGMSSVAFDAQPFLAMVLGEKAETDVVTKVLLLAGMAAMVMSMYELASSTVMLGSRSAWSCAVPIIAGAGVHLTASILGGRYIGIWAVAGGTLAGNCVTCVLMWGRARSLLSLSRREVALILSPALATLTVAGSTGYALSGLAQTHGLASLAICCATTALGITAGAIVARTIHRSRILTTAV